MIEAHELSRRDNIAAEVQTFYSALGASYVAEEAQMVSMNQGRCAELFSAIQAIRRREGFSEDNGWLADEGPADYRRLNDELGQFLEKIYDTVFVSVLRRYQLEYYADLSSAIGRNSNFSGRLAVE
jgi:hypothetical protein